MVITENQSWGVLGIVAAGFVLIGLVLIYARWAGAAKSQRVARASVVRSWIALGLVGGLLIFCGLAFAIDDPSLRSTLMGALAAAVGTAIAYYFSSKSTDQAQQAQQDLMKATVGTETVPDLTNKTADDAKKALGDTFLKLVTDPSSPTPEGRRVVDQDPAPGTVVIKTTQVVVTYGPPEVKE